MPAEPPAQSGITVSLPASGRPRGPGAVVPDAGAGPAPGGVVVAFIKTDAVHGAAGAGGYGESLFHILLTIYIEQYFVCR